MGGRLWRQEGSGTLELIGLFPFLLLVVLIMWQFTLGGYTLIVAEGAVRDAALVAAEGSSATAAAQASAGNLTTVVEDPVYQRNGDLCQVTVHLRARMPLAALPGLRGRSMWVERQAVMPADARLCP